MAGAPDNDAANESLRADVAVMRELGVIEWEHNGRRIKLGPAPLPPAEPRAERAPRPGDVHPDEAAWNDWHRRALRATGKPIPPWPGPGHRNSLGG